MHPTDREPSPGDPSDLSRRSFLAVSAALAVPILSQKPDAIVRDDRAGPPRNFVVVVTDDQRFDALGFMGHPFLETPNIDRLAKNGVVAKNAFVTTALCSPSRASMLTGQYAHTHGILDNETILPESTPIYPKLLQSAGYETGYVGKWHMGGSTDAPRPGWNFWASFRGQGPYFDPTFNIDGQPRKIEGYTTDVITDLAVDWLSGRNEKPFCLVVGHKAVHNPFTPAPRHKDLFADAPCPSPMRDEDRAYAGSPRWVRAQRRSWHGVDGTDGRGVWDGQVASFAEFYRNYMRTIVGIDESVGRIVAALEKKGILESTVFFFTSDNGFLMGEHGLLDKRCMYEESIRVPFVAHCPEIFSRGKTIDGMVANIDLAPTILELAGLPRAATMQGESFAKILRGEEIPWRESFLYEYFYETSYPQTPTVLGVRRKKWKYMEFHGIWDMRQNRALYDLETDPGEMNNLAGDAAVKDTESALSDELGRLLDRFGARRMPSWRKST